MRKTGGNCNFFPANFYQDLPEDGLDFSSTISNFKEQPSDNERG